MNKFLFIIIMLLYSAASAQEMDSVFKIITPDSLMVTDTTIAQDTTALLDSADISVIVDTLYPLNQKALFDGSTFLGQEQLKKIYTGYEGNFLQESEKIFIRDFAFTGYPDEVFYYGTNGISFLYDGLSLNSPDINFHNLKNSGDFLPESVDSIEFVPSVRGFMFGQEFNHTSINYISKDFLSEAPYSKVKYYEGPYGEGMLNALFNSLIFKKFNLYTDITNRSSDRRFENSDLSMWQAMVKLKYLLSDDYNIIGSYTFNDHKIGFNGGVDVDSIARFTTDIDQYLYDEVVAPVVYSTSQLQNKDHLFSLRLLAQPGKNLYSDLNVFYHFSLTQIHANDEIIISNNSSKYKSVGAYFEQKYNPAPLHLAIKGTFVNTDFEATNSTESAQRIFYSLSATASLSLLDSLITPAVFYRYGVTDFYMNYKQNGYGIDVTAKLIDGLKLYTGYSLVDNPIIDLQGSNFEAGLSMRSNYLNANAGYYTREVFTISTGPIPLQFPAQISHNGVNASAEIKVWSIMLTGLINYPFISGSSKDTGLPKIFSKSGIFFNDIVFSGNLDIKTGFVFYYWGEQLNSSLAGEQHIIPEANRFDFTLAGEIQKSAIVFFTWENFTDNLYYITPYYPMSGSGIRFGVSWELFN